jgi:multidrug resistance efflux pump
MTMKKAKNIILIIVAVLIFAGVGVGYYVYWQSNTYFETENAKVTAKLHTITSPVAGKLVKLNIQAGDTVGKNGIVGRVENGPFVKSPVEGVIVQSDVVLDQMVAQTTPLAVVADTSELYVQANIEETDITKIHEGQQVSVKLDAYPKKTFHAYVKEVESVTQSAASGQTMSMSTSGTYTKVTQLIPIKIELEDGVKLSDIIGTNATVKIRVK